MNLFLNVTLLYPAMLLFVTPDISLAPEFPIEFTSVRYNLDLNGGDCLDSHSTGNLMIYVHWIVDRVNQSLFDYLDLHSKAYVNYTEVCKVFQKFCMLNY